MKTTDGSGQYYVDRDIRSDVVSTRGDAVARQRNSEPAPGGPIEQMASALARMEQRLAEYQEQTSNQLAEVVARTGRIEGRLSNQDFVPQSERRRSPRRVTDEDAAPEGGEFWSYVDTGGTRTFFPCTRLRGKHDDGYGLITYDLLRMDKDKQQGPVISRAADQMFFTEEDARAAPRTSSSAKARAQRKPSIRKDG